MILAVTDVLAFIVNVQVVAVPLHAPLQPAKTPLPVVVTFSVTALPLVHAALQVVPQLIPTGVLVTVPFGAAVPVLETVNVYVAAGGGGGGGGGAAAATVNCSDVVEATPPGLTTDT